MMGSFFASLVVLLRVGVIGKMESLIKYQNGNCSVEIFTDGTKVRTFEGEAFPEHPESMDVKITDYCDAECQWCHEKSTKSGKHGDLGALMEKLDELPAGVEIAIGGGNPLSHPDLIQFLTACKARGLICNMTVNQIHLESGRELLSELFEKKLLVAVGLSIKDVETLPDWAYSLPNVVFHMIMGVNKVSDVVYLSDRATLLGAGDCRILVLGYKEYGFGLNYLARKPEVEENKYRWYVELGGMFKKVGLVLAFDNLAIKQMNLKRFFSDKAWNELFMGTDGKFSCYVDGIKREFAVSSTSGNRKSFDDVGLLQFFKGIYEAS